MRQFSYSLSKDAQRDLAQFYLYLADRGEPVPARRLVADLNAKIRNLAASGNTGVARDWISPGLRAFPHKNRCIYFRITNGHMRVLRILHSKQDIDSQMFTRPENT